MANKIFLLVITSFLNAFILSEVQSAMTEDNSIFLYGTITTEDDQTYTGQIRWGKEEAFLFDFFNATKIENENLIHLSRSEVKELDKQNSWVSTGWFGWSRSSYINNHTHSFVCQFGDILAIKPQRGDRVKVMLRNGEVLRLSGGSNDIGATVRIHDAELGMIKIDWDNISEVRFETAPDNMESAYGAPLFGQVETRSGNFTGYVQWDHDERLADDELNGDTKGGELDIPFGKIQRIKKTFSGSEVTMQSGRSFKLYGSNDVDDDNRGIIVNIMGMGRVDIPWEEFEQVTFSEPTQSTWSSSYESKPLSGSIETVDGNAYSGEIIFDLDERYDLEILDGDNDDLEYSLPFRYVSKIKPKNDEATYVTLRNGEQLLLEDSVDVNDDNDGILVADGTDDYKYIRWSDVEEIRFH
jgi:hypothetical protein